MDPRRNTGSGYMPHEQHRDENLCRIPVSLSLRPSFEFYVRSEEGINLVVDLSSSPSEWVKKLNGGVRVHSKSLNNVSQALPHEVRDLESYDPEANASSLDDTVADCTNKDDPTFVDSVLDSATGRECNHAKADSPDRSSRSTAVTQTNTPLKTSRLVEEQNQLHSSFCEANFDIHNPANMLTKRSPRTSDEHTLTSQIKTTGSPVMDSKSVGPKSIEEPQSKSVGTNLEKTETGPVGISHLFSGWRLSLASGVLETRKPFTGIHGKASGSCRQISKSGNPAELHLSEAESLHEDMADSPCQNGGAPNPENPTHNLQNEIGNLVKCDFDLNKSLDPVSECPGELLLQPRNNHTNTAESSECSQSCMKAENCKRLDNSDSEECQTKRQHSQVDDIDNLAAKRSRSAKNLSKESRPRRSMRLVSK